MSLISGIGDWLRRLGRALSHLFVQAVDTETGVFDAYFSMSDDIHAFVANLRGFRRFEFDPKFKTRVINVPRAYDAINDLLDIIIHGLRDKFTELGDRVTTIKNTLEPSHAPPEEGAGAVANVQAQLATFKLACVHLKEAFHDALEIEQMLLDVKQRLETLDDLFLPQGNPKQIVDKHYRARIRS